MILIWVICQKKKMGGQKFIIKTIISSFINQQQKAVKSHVYSKSKNHHVCVQQDTLLLPCPLLVTGEECWLPQTSLRVGRCCSWWGATATIMPCKSCCGLSLVMRYWGVVALVGGSLSSLAKERCGGDGLFQRWIAIG